MTALNLYNQIIQIVRAYRKAPMAMCANVSRGKLRYLGRGMYVEVPTTLPEMTIGVYSLSQLADWLFTLPDDQQVRVEARKNTVVFTSGDTVISFHSPGTTEDYDSIDEIVLTPLLTNTYELNVMKSDIIAAKTAFDTLVNLAHSNVEAVDVSVIGPTIMLSMKSKYGSGKHVITHTGPVTPTDWSGRFTHEAFTYIPSEFQKAVPKDGTMVPAIYYQPVEPTVKISFKNHEAKKLSPLMFNYSNGVTVVLSPIWN